MVATSRLSFHLLDLPSSADPTRFVDFGRRVEGYLPGEATQKEVEEIQKALYDVSSGTGSLGSGGSDG
jgi:hypothetical protein